MSRTLQPLRALIADPGNSDVRAACWQLVHGPAKIRFAGTGHDRPFRLMAAEVAERICMQSQSYQRWVPILSSVLDALTPVADPLEASAIPAEAVSAWRDRKDIGG